MLRMMTYLRGMTGLLRYDHDICCPVDCTNVCRTMQTFVYTQLCRVTNGSVVQPSCNVSCASDSADVHNIALLATTHAQHRLLGLTKGANNVRLKATLAGSELWLRVLCYLLGSGSVAPGSLS